ncbi:YkvA family protein [Coralloluteibacterium thermophilus]|uniref:YkvA family protein n=1 Tax=Coralloluteibacterium thermophilum TaxID=2707049 RepID=A0ABV9NJJ1_9GAMM
MTLSLAIELSDADLEHFREAQREAARRAEGRPAEEAIAAAEALLKEADLARVPDFVAQRLERLDGLVAMLRDEGWALPEEDRRHVLAALVYFADPADAIPDHVPVLGFLDDAIMIELCVRELRNEIEAYEDFCAFREHEALRRGQDPATIGRADWLAPRRDELIERMRSRRARDMGVGYGSSSGYGGTRTYKRPWRPGVIRTS